MNEDEGSVKIMFYPYFVPGVIFSSMYTVLPYCVIVELALW